MNSVNCDCFEPSDYRLAYKNADSGNDIYNDKPHKRVVRQYGSTIHAPPVDNENMEQIHTQRQAGNASNAFLDSIWALLQ